ncbi:MAG: hypothetical protein BAJALOKI3v1_690006 [Promethearchaeota archaeon]|nr:MAG: hypothetical protein BAJALOKI3v1_690006 [Candidatus Lokiarchaeota archaeon]
MQESSDAPMREDRNKKPFVSTRHRDAEPDTYDPNIPRLGRRESEPHSAEITYIYDVLTTNFPDDRTMWDLHHYFKKNGLKIDIQFDISFFKGLKIPYDLPSYQAKDFDNRVPSMAINILSPSTWRSDLAEKLDYCRLLEIPLYIVFNSYHVATNIYKPPFARAYLLQDNGDYKIKELRKVSINVSGEFVSDALIDVSGIVPFRIGIKKRERKFQNDKPLYRLVLAKPDKDELFLTENEINKRTIDDQAKTIDDQAKTIEKLREEILNLKEKLDNKMSSN